jgi:ATPase subunit of ABC transporter with duplicated ATPase domains
MSSHILGLQGTLLVLDEPTNHLDIPSKETLEEAVRAFQGVLVEVVTKQSSLLGYTLT